MTSPSDTRPPFRTARPTTLPACGDGTSMEALSVSSVMSGSSAATSSPSFTSTSMISTSVKSPMSGTRTSILSGIACS